MFKFRCSVSVMVRDGFRIRVRFTGKFSVRFSVGLGWKLDIGLGLCLLLLGLGTGLEISFWCGFKLCIGLGFKFSVRFKIRV